MTDWSRYARLKAMPRRCLLLLGLLRVALSTVGLITAAQASATATELKGAGAGKSPLTLATGLY